MFAYGLFVAGGLDYLFEFTCLCVSAFSLIVVLHFCLLICGTIRDKIVGVAVLYVWLIALV